jgi:hypothetical protein
MTVAAEAGLKPEKKSYAISFSLPLVIGYRVASKALNRRTDLASIHRQIFEGDRVLTGEVPPELG